MRHARRVRWRHVFGGWLLIRSWIRLGIVTLALRWLGFRTVVGWVPVAQPRQISAADTVRAHRYATWIGVAACIQPVRALCLARSLTLHWWLRREGIPSELKIGVAKDGRELAAHAWVELDGVPVNETLAEVAPFTALTGAGDGRAATSEVHGGSNRGAPSTDGLASRAIAS